MIFKNIPPPAAKKLTDLYLSHRRIVCLLPLIQLFALKAFFLEITRGASFAEEQQF